MTGTEPASMPEVDAAAHGAAAARRLVVAYCFTPYVDTSGTVAAKRVRIREEPVDLIQNEMSSIRETDDGLRAIADDLVRRRAVLPTTTRFSSWPSITEWCQAGEKQVSTWVDESVVRGDCRDGSVPWETLYSRSHFVASHFLAALIKAEHPEVRWEAEFSDPCSADATGATRYAPIADDALRARFARLIEAAGFTAPDSDNVFLWAETLVYALADEIQFTNANQASYMLGRCDDAQLRRRLESHTTVAHHPMLPERFYEMDRAPLELEPDCIHIAYFGNFYGKQSPVAAVEAVADLPLDQRAQLRLHIFTKPTAQLRRRVEELEIMDVVKVEEFLPFLQFLEIARRMDLLLVVDYPLPAGADVNPFLLSKWGDYKGSRTPVWGMLEESSTLSTSGDAALQFRTPVDHRSAAAQFLSRLARGKETIRPVLATS